MCVIRRVGRSRGVREFLDGLPKTQSNQDTFHSDISSTGTHVNPSVSSSSPVQYSEDTSASLLVESTSILRAIFIFPYFSLFFPQPMDDTLDLRLLPMVFYVSMYPLSLLSHALLCHKTPS